MKYNILISDILIKDFVNVYKKDFCVDCLWKLESKIDFNKYQGIVVTGGFKTDKKFLKKFKNLKIVSVFGVGYDGVDLNYCKNNNIYVTNNNNMKNIIEILCGITFITILFTMSVFLLNSFCILPYSGFKSLVIPSAAIN